ncbi:MAG TPA: anaerobic ribonucleoside-triphosphate reductase activating protein [Candidatus Altiarchaeales archaeon]|nr:MAG: anaerobic ribonucleoside-triphosphate reductase activating protein [Candidatus Altiarchaeales archaeon]HDN83478.1 anaerobic ribonucleoside-triphosphate reductase activating protein [Candidatus Altiarchaeales archaeon]
MTKINFAGIVDHSTLDYPGKVCAVVYLCGCPFRCPWCQNVELVLKRGTCKPTEISLIVSELEENFLIDAVCVTGGEPLMQNEALELLKEIKERTPLLLKIDTNGFFPERLKRALKYLDFISIDIKAPLDDRYCKVVGLPNREEIILPKLKESLALIKDFKGKEARTTIVPGLIDKPEEIEAIAEVVKKFGFEIYTLQQFRAGKTLDPSYEKLPQPSPELMKTLGRIAKEKLPDIKVQVVTVQNGFEEIKLE